MKKVAFYFIFLFVLTSAKAQHFEAGILLGGSNYLGDLSENSSRLILKETKFAGGVFAGYQFNDFIGLKLGFNYANVAGSDANAKDEVVQGRNLSFESSILEFSLRAEWNIIGFQPYNFSRPWSPFLFAGIAGFKYDPKAVYGDQTIALQPLGTEGQGMEGRDAKYGLFKMSIPMGLGVKFLLSEKFTIGIEAGARYTLTDYLDDVSGTYVNYEDLLAANGELAAAMGNRQGEFQGKPPIIVPTGTQRGDDNNNDWYFIAGVTISYNFIDSGMLGSRKRIRRKRSGCPVD